MEVYRKSSWLFLLLGVSLLATALQGVQGEVELGPSESECRPYIERALKELETGDGIEEASLESAASLEGIPTVDVTSDDSSAQQQSVDGVEGEHETTTESIEESTTSEDVLSEQTKESDEVKSAEQSEEQAASDQKEEAGSQEAVEATAESTETTEQQSEEAKEGGEDVPHEVSEEAPKEESVEEPVATEEVATEQTEEAASSVEEPTGTSTEESASSVEDQPASSSAEGQPAASSVEEQPAASAEEHATASSAEEQPASSSAEEQPAEETTASLEEQATSEEPATTTEEAAPVSEETASVEEQASQSEEAASQPEEAASQSEEVAGQPEEAAQSEEAATQSDEAPSQSEEAPAQTEEAAPQSEEAAPVESLESAEAAPADEPIAEEVAPVESSESVEQHQAEQTVEASSSTESTEDSKQIEEQPASVDEPATSETASQEVEAPKESEEPAPIEDLSSETVQAEAEPVPEEDLTLDIEIPTDLRPRDHVEQLLKLDDDSKTTESIINKVSEVTLRELKKLYENAIKPLEVLYKYRDLSNRHFGDAEIFSKPLVLFMGPWSGGKSSIINYLSNNEYNETSLRTGAEPSPAYFNILMHGDEPEVIDGTELAADFTFSGLQKFGQGLEERLRGVKLPTKLLEKVNIVEIPGILEVRKQVSRVFPFNDACQWFIDRADIIFLVYDPSKLDVGPETEAILDQLKGREHQTRIILNKADQVKPEELMRVQGALIWNISPLMSSPQPPVMYTTSLWSRPYESWAPVRLLQAQERAFLRDLRGAIDKRIENKIASARRFAVRVRNHAKMVDCYLTTYYNHKSVFGNRKLVADEIIEHPQDYHIYEGLSTLTNISRYDLPDPEVYKDFFKLNALYDFQQLSATCTYFRGCPINRLDVAIAYDLPELVGTHRRLVETALAGASPASAPPGGS